MWNRSLRIATTKWASILIFVATAALATSTSAPAVIGASSCTKLIPTGGPYDILRTSSSEELHELLDEYFAKKDYKTHDEAINDGFSIGFRVYGVPLQSGGTFTKAEKDAWFSEYKQRRKLKLDTAKQSAFEQLVINVPAVKEISKCIIATEGFGLRASFEATSDCTATFSAWYRPVRDGERPLKVAGSGLMVRGGTCDPWPKNVVSVGPTFVQCKRNRRDALVVTINTKDGPGGEAQIEALPPLGPEPKLHDVWGDTFSKPTSTIVERYHGNFTKWNGPGSDLGDWRFTFYSDISSPNEGPMVPELLECRGCTAHFWLCPDGGICPHPTFEKLSDQTWRIWGFRNSDNPPIVVRVKINYYEKERKCTANCGADVIYANWVAEKNRTCPVAPSSNSKPVKQAK